MEEQYIYNYLALTACLISDKPIDTNYAIKRVTGQDVSDKVISHSKTRRIIIIDTLTNQKIEFESQGAASKYLGVNRNTTGIYVKSGKIYKERYYFKIA